MKLIGMHYYPDEKELKSIETWDVTTSKGLKGLIKYIKGMWISCGNDSAFMFNTGRYNYVLGLTTVGWSGNEDIIEALEKNYNFWDGWHTIKRGGHYYFEWYKEKFRDES